MNRDREAERWEEDYSRRGRVWGGAVHNLPPLSRGERVLELGCGNGKTSRAILGLTSDVVGIDLSASAVRLCRAHAPGSSGGQLALADARSLPFFDAVFDAVVAFHVIGHLPGEGRARSAHEAARVLRAGGTCSSPVFRPRISGLAPDAKQNRERLYGKTGSPPITSPKMKYWRFSRD